jgi:hypothetical protein
MDGEMQHLAVPGDDPFNGGQDGIAERGVVAADNLLPGGPGQVPRKFGEQSPVVQGAVEVDQQPAAATIVRRLGQPLQTPADLGGADIVTEVGIKQMTGAGQQVAIRFGNERRGMFTAEQQSHGRNTVLVMSERASRR